MKNAHLRRYLHSSSLRRTSMYASLLGISGALHLGVFDQPAWQVLFSNLLEGQVNFLAALDILAGAINLDNQMYPGCYSPQGLIVRYEGFPGFLGFTD
jgi:hypothetical protein